MNRVDLGLHGPFPATTGPLGELVYFNANLIQVVNDVLLDPGPDRFPKSPSPKVGVDGKPRPASPFLQLLLLLGTEVEPMRDCAAVFRIFLWAAAWRPAALRLLARRLSFFPAPLALIC